MRTLLVFLFMLATATCVPAGELNWLVDYHAAINLARSTERPMLLVISRGNPFPSSGERTGVFPAQDVLETYVLCTIDANSDYGQRVAKAFQVTEFPHSVVIDKTTKKILYRQVGSFTKESWTSMLTKYQHYEPVTVVTAPQTQSSVRIQTRPSPTSLFLRQPANCNT